MADWVIKYWPPGGKGDVERWYSKLDHEQQKVVFEMLVMLEEGGNDLKLPHSKPLGKKLFELREKRYAFRIYYMFYKGHIIVLLAAGDKSSQDRDIKIARERLAIILKRGKELL